MRNNNTGYDFKPKLNEHKVDHSKSYRSKNKMIKKGTSSHSIIEIQNGDLKQHNLII